ncbi:outer membrane protein assembly factor BamB family protein [Planctopirus hydrillae]|uniref:Pyrrolo-quinoline quinone repeat domain-containing protein n=1 Tax=Planctopirus hydrillae TaxID=1841610 RepID=A0A1C3EH69_9PLAN|nr:PQQ-binding-like beta-propeller repeat protein [Planctopirus hydrillae]ODA32578.1 hypothetical protein A6X21_19620 [Planctopirus hydrillae]
MPELVVVCPGTANRVLELTKTHPVMIGSLEFNEIVVPGDNVPAVVCRVSWNGSAFEVTVAGTPSVSVNGADVARSELSAGDVITIGKVAIRYQDLQQQGTEKSLLAPEAQALPRKSPRKGQPEQPVVIIEEESSTSLSDLPTLPTRDNAIASRLAARESVGSPGGSSSEKPDLRQRGFKTAPALARPGEEDLVRSPFVLGMAICVGLLIVAGLVTTFLIQQRSLEREFSLAELDFKEGRFSQAYEGFQKFSTNHPRAKRSQEARRYAWKAAIERELLGATPDFTQAMSHLQKWIVDDRDAEDFSSIRPDLLRAAERIATGSATASAANANAELLSISDEATRLIERYNDDRTSLTASLERLEQLRKAANRALVRKNRLDTATREIQSALKADQALKALAIHRQLMDHHPDLKKNPELNELLAEAIRLETKQVIERPAESLPQPDKPREAASVMPYFRQRSRSEDATSSLILPLRLKDSLVAIQPETGKLLWQYPLGRSISAFAIPLAGNAERWLAWSEREQGLILFDSENGRPLWLCPTGQLAPGIPAQAENSLFVSVASGEIWRIDKETGRVTAALKFPQRLVTQPVLLRDATHLVAGGEQSLLYTFSRNPLQIVAATYLGHDKHTLTVPQLATGDLLLVGENDQLDTARLHVLSTGQPLQPLAIRQTLELPGLLMGAGKIRGSTLVLPLVGERLALFNVSDQPGMTPLTEVDGYPLQSNYNGPIELWFSPQDEIWMYGSRLKRFSTRSDGLSLLSGESITGWAAGPITSFDRQVMIPRRASWTTGTTTSTVNLAGQPGNWKMISGGRLLGSVTTPDRMLTASEAGILSLWTTISHDGSSVMESQVAIDLPPLENWQLFAIPWNGKLIITASRAESADSSTRYWIYEGTSTLPPSRPIEGRLESAPFPLDGGIVLFQPGTATWLNPQTGQKSQVLQPQVATSSDSILQKSWKCAAVLPDSIVAATKDGELWKLAMVQGQLTRIATIKLPDADVAQMASCGRYIAVLLRSGQLDRSAQVHLYLAETFDPRGTIELSDSESGNEIQTLIGDSQSLIASTSQGVEHFDLSGSFNAAIVSQTTPHRWKIATKQPHRLLAHFQDTTIWIVTAPDQVQLVDRRSGKVLHSVRTQIQIDSLLVAFGKLFAASSDLAIELIANPASHVIENRQQTLNTSDSANRAVEGIEP